MAQTEAQKRAMAKYLSNPENRKKRTAQNLVYIRRKRHEKNIEHAKTIIAMEDNVDAVVDYIENVLKHRKSRD